MTTAGTMPGNGRSEAEDLLALHREMLRIRHFEEQVRILSQGGLVPGLVHLCSGQEATNVGVCSLLRRTDVIASHHRGHGHCLAKGARADLLMAEILGRAPGYCGGRSGSLHIFDPENNNFGTNGIVGGGIPLATGVALTIRNRGGDEVAVTFFGDGALNQGLVPECMNMAAIWNLPVVFVFENNGFGEFTALEDVTAGNSLTARGAVFDIPSAEVDGMDVLEVRAVFSQALGRARKGEGPSFLVCNTYRFGGHHAGDKQEYKDQEQARLWRERDPIARLAATIVESGAATREDLEAGESEVIAEMKSAVAFAKAAPHPQAEDLARNVYA